MPCTAIIRDASSCSGWGQIQRPVVNVQRVRDLGRLSPNRDDVSVKPLASGLRELRRRGTQPQQLPHESTHSLSSGKEVCYDNLGCFSDTQPWAGTAIRPLRLLPWSPEKINTRFLLYTNENPNAFQVRFLWEASPNLCTCSPGMAHFLGEWMVHRSWILLLSP